MRVTEPTASRSGRRTSRPCTLLAPRSSSDTRDRSVRRDETYAMRGLPSPRSARWRARKIHRRWNRAFDDRREALVGGRSARPRVVTSERTPVDGAVDLRRGEGDVILCAHRQARADRHPTHDWRRRARIPAIFGGRPTVRLAIVSSTTRARRLPPAATLRRYGHGDVQHGIEHELRSPDAAAVSPARADGHRARGRPSTADTVTSHRRRAWNPPATSGCSASLRSGTRRDNSSTAIAAPACAGSAAPGADGEERQHAWIARTGGARRETARRAPRAACASDRRQARQPRPAPALSVSAAHRHSGAQVRRRPDARLIASPRPPPETLPSATGASASTADRTGGREHVPMSASVHCGSRRVQPRDRGCRRRARRTSPWRLADDDRRLRLGRRTSSRSRR